MNKRFIVTVLDGFGVGEMPDVKDKRPQDIGSNTFNNLLLKNPKINIPNLKKMGVIDYLVNSTFKENKISEFNISFGKFSLQHEGADSFWGHQEMAGTLPQIPNRQFVRNEKDLIMKQLKSKGFDCNYKDGLIIVDEHIAVADNVEADPGLIINVLGSLDYYDFDYIAKIGWAVREVVKTSRVNTMGGINLKQEDFYKCFVSRKMDGFEGKGIDCAKAKIFNEKYRVIHMGYGVNPETQTPQILDHHKIPVTLIGKTADFIQVKNAKYLPMVYTDKIIELLKQELVEMDFGFIFSNIQETDLAGHDMDVSKYSKKLELFDQNIPEILSKLRESDIWLITGDHGNDPTIGHSNHTREYTPLIMISKTLDSKDYKIRSTLSDIGATISDYFDCPPPENGKSLFK